MIGNILLKIKNYDDLYDDFLKLKQSNDNLNIYIQKLELDLHDSKSTLKETDEKYSLLKSKLNHIELPKVGLKELEKKLVLADIYTMKIIIDYLTLDSYELVKNIASRVDKNNLSEYIAYRDGALGRNEELKKLLLKYVSKTDNFIDRISGEEKLKKINY